MGEIMIASARQNAGRLIATGIAIVLAVAFVVAGLTITGSYTKSLQDGITADMVHADIKVLLKDTVGEDSDLVNEQVDSAISTLTQLPTVEAAGAVRLTAANYREHGAREFFQVYAALPEQIEYRELAEGAWPASATEVVISAKRAKELNLARGDELRLSSATGEDSVTKTFTVVGIMKQAEASTELLGADVLMNDEALRSFSSFLSQSGILVKATAGTTPDSLVTAAREALPNDRYIVQTREEVAATAISETAGSTLVIQAFILAFGGIALFIAGFVIANTFRLLVAQRTKELALLRCVGTTKRQVWALVIGEAALIGLVFSILGAVIGVGAAYGLQAILVAVEETFAGATIHVDPIAVIVSIALGTAATTVFALGPARNAVRVHPLAAMRPVEAAQVQRTSLLTLGLGTLITALGTGVMWYFANTEQFAGAVLGGVVSGIGVIILCKETLPPLIGLVGRAVAPLSATTALAAANATRNKQRTAATGTALLIGTVLIAMLTTGTTSVRESVLSTINERRPIDLVVMTGGEAAITPDQVDQIKSVEHVEAVAPITTGQVEAVDTSGKPVDLNVQAVDAASFSQAVHAEPSFLPQLGEAVVAKDNIANLKAGETITLRGANGEQSVTVRIETKLNPEDLYIAGPVLAKLVNQPEITQVVVKLPTGIGIDEVGNVTKAIEGKGDDWFVVGPAVERALYTNILNIILMVILGLLGISIIIAVVGIGNTAALSVWERRHESAMMRAVGFTRGQLVAMITTEAVLAALVSVGVGIGLGIFYAHAGLTALANTAPNVTFSLYIPWDQLGMIVIGAGVAAVLAAWLPGIRAARRPMVNDLVVS